MATKNLTFNNVIIDFPKIIFKKGGKSSDQHKEKQKQSLYDVGQLRSGGEIEALVREARLHLKNGGQ